MDTWGQNLGKKIWSTLGPSVVVCRTIRSTPTEHIWVMSGGFRPMVRPAWALYEISLNKTFLIIQSSTNVKLHGAGCFTASLKPLAPLKSQLTTHKGPVWHETRAMSKIKTERLCCQGTKEDQNETRIRRRGPVISVELRVQSHLIYLVIVHCVVGMYLTLSWHSPSWSKKLPFLSMDVAICWNPKVFFLSLQSSWVYSSPPFLRAVPTQTLR